MNANDYSQNLPFGITLCNSDGIIEYMNDKSKEIFKEDGGEKLVGKNLFDCHSQKSKMQLQDMFAEKKENFYTIQKKGKKKLIYQFPLFEGEKFTGFGEISIVIPEEMPHYIRD
jgi:c-di-AMP phosphodiesterase-like protein